MNKGNIPVAIALVGILLIFVTAAIASIYNSQKTNEKWDWGCYEPLARKICSENGLDFEQLFLTIGPGRPYSSFKCKTRDREIISRDFRFLDSDCLGGDESK